MCPVALAGTLRNTMWQKHDELSGALCDGGKGTEREANACKPRLKRVNKKVARKGVLTSMITRPQALLLPLPAPQPPALFRSSVTSRPAGISGLGHLLRGGEEWRTENQRTLSLHVPPLGPHASRSGGTALYFCSLLSASFEKCTLKNSVFWILEK